MTNRLKEMGEAASWRLLNAAAIEGAKQQGYALKRLPGRGRSNTYEIAKDGATKIASVRTTRDRWIAFPPLEGGKRWKTLDNADVVLVSAVDDPLNPQNVEVYLFPAVEVRKRFDASYAARIANGHTVCDDFGMWVMLDKGDDGFPGEVGHSLAIDYPAVARFTIDELEAETAPVPKATAEQPPAQRREADEYDAGPKLATVAEVLAFARQKVASLTGMPASAIHLDLKMGV